MVADQSGGPLQTLDNLLDKAALTGEFLCRYWMLLVLCGGLGGALGALSIFVRVPQSVASCEIVLRGVQPNRRQQVERLVDYFELAERNFVAPDLVQIGRRSATIPGRCRRGGCLAGSRDGWSGRLRGQLLQRRSTLRRRVLGPPREELLGAADWRAISVVKSEADLLRGQYQENEDQLRALEGKLREFKQKHLDALPRMRKASWAVAARCSRSGTCWPLSSIAPIETHLGRASSPNSGDAQITRSVVKAQPLRISSGCSASAARSRSRAGFADSHPDIVRLKAQEAELVGLQKQALRDAVSDSEMRADSSVRLLNTRIGQLEVMVNTTAKELSTVEGRLGNLSKIMGAMPEVEAGYSELQRKLTSAQALHAGLHDQLKAKEPSSSSSGRPWLRVTK